ncbi:MAG: exodeoxyribonuclease VII large subunit [Desulfovibrionaceae bacterium]|nr:exodeoxyribonuclease VII large subunit [Desulfovibrionaceae bacterium]
MSIRVYTVSELACELKSQLESRFASCWVRGEVTGAKKIGSGHIYFTLKDKDAQISCAWFSGRRLAAMRQDAYDPETGVILGRAAHATESMLLEGGAFFCSGMISFYPARGSCQLIVSDVIASGEGLLAQEFEARKAALAKKGYFASERKRKLPENPKRVALITSEIGAAIHDFLKIAKNRGLPASIRLFPTLVQGKAAAHAIAEAIEAACAQGWAEVLVLIRGGGSLEDLWCFNEQEVADAVFRSTIPVLAGIGHEIDFTLADMTADLRASTPTHAAELLWRPRSLFAAELEQVRLRLLRAVTDSLETLSKNLDNELRALRLSSPQNRLHTMDERLLNMQRALYNAARSLLEERDRLLFLVTSRLRESMAPARMDEQLARLAMLVQSLWQSWLRAFDRADKEREQYETRLGHTWARLLDERVASFEKMAALLDSASPLALLGRGYALIEDREGEVVRSAKALAHGDPLRIYFKDGLVRARVEEELLEETFYEER